MDGANVIAKCLKDQGIEYIFGVVGVPIVEVAVVAQQYGIKFIGMRNEQSACYAAQAMGYLTGKPAVCLVVSGPGLLHALGGMANACLNEWPVLILGGSSDLDQLTMGAFQEWPQVECAKSYCKFAGQPGSVETIPVFIEKALRYALYGRPGATYVDIPGNFVTETVNEKNIQFRPRVKPSPISLPLMDDVTKAVNILTRSERPLMVIGQGAATGTNCQRRMISFIESHQLPFLATSSGKGIIPDDHPNSAAAARTFILKEADVVVLVGARLNWQLHFGQAPRFNASVKIIQIEEVPEEFHQNAVSEAVLCGKVEKSIELLDSKLGQWKFPWNSTWWKDIEKKVAKNSEMVTRMAMDATEPLNYFAAFAPLRDLLPKDAIVINEGANTMDIGRTMLPNFLPRHRLDAGVFGTMGVGLGYATAAALYCRDYFPEKRVICVQGDSAFGFSGMEIETLCRYKLAIIIVVINNNGIYGGVSRSNYENLGGDLTLTLAPTLLMADARYDILATAFGGKGHFCHSQTEIRNAFEEALKDRNRLHLLNIAINPDAERKPQEFSWLTRSKM